MPPLRASLGALAVTALVATTVVLAPAGEAVTPTEGPTVSSTHRGQWSSLLDGRATFDIDAGVGGEAEAEGAEVASYDVRLLRASMTARSAPAWTTPAALQGLAVMPSERHRGDLDVRKVLRLAVPQGEVLCVSARATDTLGNVGAWEQRVCVARFLDDSRLGRRGDLDTVHDRRFAGGSATSIDRSGALVLRGVPRRARVVVLWAHGRQDDRAGSIHVRSKVGHGVRTTCQAGTWSVRPQVHRREYCLRLHPRRGPIALTGDTDAPTVPVEGLLVVPAWAR